MDRLCLDFLLWRFSLSYASDKTKEKFEDSSLEREHKFEHGLRGRIELVRTVPVAPSIKQKDDLLAKAINDLLIGHFPAKAGLVVEASYQPGSYDISNGNLCACEVRLGIEPSPPRNDPLGINDTPTFCVSVVARRSYSCINRNGSFTADVSFQLILLSLDIGGKM